jgi:hypothetical protein
VLEAPDAGISRTQTLPTYTVDHQCDWRDHTGLDFERLELESGGYASGHQHRTGPLFKPLQRPQIPRPILPPFPFLLSVSWLATRSSLRTIGIPALECTRARLPV